MSLRHPAMKAMYLPDVEDHPKPGPFADAIRAMQEAGSEYPQIWHLFAFLPSATQHLARFTQEILRGPGPLSPGLRELIAAYTSRGNACGFCGTSHTAIAIEMLGDEALVRGVVNDLESSPLDEKHKALFRFVRKVNHDSAGISSEDMDSLRELGWNDEAIYFASTICALFNFYNRWIHANGVHELSREAHLEGAKRTALRGYARD